MEKTAKQLAIEKAYGELFDKLKHSIDLDGNCVMFDSNNKQATPNFNDLNFEKEYVNNNLDYGYDSERNIHFWRPKTLQGIEDNNGWTRIESEADLPTDESVKYTTGTLCFDGHFEVSHIHFTAKTIRISGGTHYKPIEKELPPIY